MLYKQFHITELYKPGVFIVSAYSHTITDHVKNCCMQGLLKEAFTYRTYCNKLHAEESLVNSLVKKNNGEICLGLHFNHELFHTVLKTSHI